MNKRILIAVLACLLCVALLCVAGCSLEQTVCDDNKSMNYTIPDMELAAGQSRKIPSLVADNGKNATYTLSKEGVVEVKNGTVYALADGEVTVTARIECVESIFDVIVRDRYYKLAVSNDTSKGTIKGLLSEYLAGTNATLTITPKSFYVPVSITVDETTYNLVNNSATFPVTAAHNVTVNYYTPQHNLTIDNQSSGILTGFTAGEQDQGTVSGTLTAAGSHLIPIVWVNDKPIHLDPPDDAEQVEYDISFYLDKDTTLKVRFYNMTARDTTNDNITTVLNYGAQMTNSYYMFTDNKEVLAEDLSTGSTNLNIPAEQRLVNTYVYRGLPYNLGRTSVEAFKLDAIATMSGSITSGSNAGSYTVTKIDNSGYLNKWYLIYGASCSDVPLHAWSKICGDIKITGAGELNIANNVWKVGKYTATVNAKGHYVDTYADIETNGSTVMCEAYSMLRPGDGCARYGAGASSGHGILVTEVVVNKNSSGVINPATSYIRYLDSHGAMAATGEIMRINGVNYPVYSGCTYNGQMSFTTLMNEGYLPVTCKQLLTPLDEVTPAVTDSVTNPTLSNMLTGTITATNPISHFTMTITDEGDNVVQQATRLWANNDNMLANINTLGSQYLIEWSSNTAETYKCYPVEDTIDVSRLSSGNYHCELTVYLGCNYSETTRSFDFTI
ncbi:MAG: hypothetical protein J6K84_00910 [Oscillospiraceae bacterium]|nr:hypothetical protein [Oscillospiraceae bacterium]